ncbi:transposase [Paenibacillus larvae subsp. larvae DSM 25430]|uniref:Transposase n=1 Tax=Paenibacillus larvae subsp. larvae DSM 25430 TaxID=697284 RepID=V9W766_9BACL|nr:transposase [Paenibacillus larvae subsp. larvae DSM 25430]AQR76977.1 hypothetical protein BXP28_05980 [Paenibacillus larvae subsp. larvae]
MKRCFFLCQTTFDENDAGIAEMESDKDHIHLLIECKPQHYIPNIVKANHAISSLVPMQPSRDTWSWLFLYWSCMYWCSWKSKRKKRRLQKR